MRDPYQFTPSAPPVYSPRQRRDQIKALYHLKERSGRPMTRLAQEAVDRYLEGFGGAAMVIREAGDSFARETEGSEHDGAREAGS